MASTDAVPLSPWLTIWWRPQATIAAVVARGPGLAIPLIAALAGISSILSAPTDLPRPSLVAVALIGGPLLGLVSLYVSGALTAWTGRLLGGRASQSAVRAALGWSLVPMVAGLPLLLGAVFVFGPQFVRHVSGGEVGQPAAVVILWVVVLLSLWGVFLTIRTIGAVQRFGIFRSMVSTVMPMIVLLGAAQAIRTFAFQPFNVPARSMEPTLLVGDYFFANKSSYGWSKYTLPFGDGLAGRVMGTPPERGDLVIFKLPGDPHIDYVKRIIGLPGDEIRMVDGVLYINDAPVPKKPIGEFASPGSEGLTPVYEEELPNGAKYSVLDAEPNGPFDNVGPYKVPEGHYFVMGDNRDNSNDSRAAWGVGFVPYENLVGQVTAVFFSATKADGEESVASAFNSIQMGANLPLSALTAGSGEKELEIYAGCSTFIPAAGFVRSTYVPRGL